MTLKSFAVQHEQMNELKKQDYMLPFISTKLPNIAEADSTKIVADGSRVARSVFGKRQFLIAVLVRPKINVTIKSHQMND